MEQFGLHLGKDDIFKNGILENTPLTAMAFFLGPPQRWGTRKIPSKKVELFKKTLAKCKNLTGDQIVVHGCYLMNPASDRLDVRAKTKDMFVNELQLCDELGVGKYVFHPGCHPNPQKGLEYTVELIKHGLSHSTHVQILVENMTQTNRLCQTWEDIKWVLDQVNDKRVNVCLDTAHCWGAGKKRGMVMETLLDDFDRIIGIDRLGAIHLNDSKVAYGSNVDRHADILSGQIPHSFWKPFIFDERIKHIPAILETPTNCRHVVEKMIQSGPLEEFSSQPSVLKNTLFEKVEEKKQETMEKFIEIDSCEKTQEKKVTFNDMELWLDPLWKDVLKEEFEKPYFKELKSFLYSEEEKGKVIFPPKHKIFNVFNQCKPSNIKVVIIGQDPYHGLNQAEGLSFSVPEGIPIPSSLQNIYKELLSDIPEFIKPKNGHLMNWVQQGVFLLNAGLTVRMKEANSHKNKGWQHFTDAVIQYLNKNFTNLVFILWGSFAQKKGKNIDKKKHYVLTSTHPSGLSAHRGFFGCKHFSKCNEYLKSCGKEEIKW